jgi:hypothetical protein
MVHSETGFQLYLRKINAVTTDSELHVGKKRFVKQRQAGANPHHVHAYPPADPAFVIQDLHLAVRCLWFVVEWI